MGSARARSRSGLIFALDKFPCRIALYLLWGLVLCKGLIAEKGELWEMESSMLSLRGLFRVGGNNGRRRSVNSKSRGVGGVCCDVVGFGVLRTAMIDD